LQETDEL